MVHHIAYMHAIINHWLRLASLHIPRCLPGGNAILGYPYGPMNLPVWGGLSDDHKGNDGLKCKSDASKSHKHDATACTRPSECERSCIHINLSTYKHNTTNPVDLFNILPSRQIPQALRRLVDTNGSTRPEVCHNHRK